MKLISTLLLLAAASPLALASSSPKNYIFFLPDGYGPASETFARDFANYKNNDTSKLPVDDLALGYVRTFASDTLVTDSAAAATAYACGIKTYNGAIGVDDNYMPYGSILEAAKLDGYKTALVVTSRITHASPAGFATHTYYRDLEGDIADQLVGYAHPLGRVVDIMMGGGRCFFLPSSDSDSCRDDDLNLWELAQTDYNWTMTTARESFDELRNGFSGDNLPFAFIPTLDHMAYEIDRDPIEEPSLTEMAITALNWLDRLTTNSTKGFFLFLEASRIDHAGHVHDPVGHLHDILEYNRAMEAVKQWIDEHPDTSLVSAADHECGGLTLGVPDYAWYPEILDVASSTPTVLVEKYEAVTESKNFTQGQLEELLDDIVFKPLGIFNVTDDEFDAAYAADDLAIYAGELLSARAGINWSTLGHTAVDITLFGYGKNTEKLVGNYENTEVGHFVTNQLGLNLKNVTALLQANETFVKAIGPDAESKKLLKRRLQEDHESMHAGVHKHKH
ncbi:alkaline-phosphatase-like protein [Limtongia smithiae]|uniref:alkaline-phosphatase-like protein n=1 Tax=Limtongia smithiae TaxID=1125753 RepID=UPI0034D021D1